MRWIYRLPLWLRSLFRKAQVDQELSDELRFHLARQIEENVAQGMNAEEARYAAQRELGGTEQIKEECRDMRRVNLLEDLIRDIGYGLRQLRRNPGFTAAVVLSLALGIGANTAIFSLTDAVMLRMLPVKNPKALVLLSWKQWEGHTNTDIVAVRSDNGAVNDAPFSYPAFEEFRSHNDVFSSLFGFVPLGVAEIGINGRASLAKGELVTGDYFSGLGVAPVLGRAITRQDEKPGVPRVAVISYGYWLRKFGRSPKVIGKAITIDGVPFAIAGVAPPEFFGVQPGHADDVWVPLVEDSKLLPYGMDSTPGGRPLLTSRDWWWLLVMGRLKPGVTKRQAAAQLNVLFRQSVTAGLKAPPQQQAIPGIELEPAARGISLLRQQFSEPLALLTILAGLVLVIACANVAGLLIARSAARQNEIAVRLSLGAPRQRLIRQLLTESVLLSGCGGALGLLFAAWGNHALFFLVPGGGSALSLDLRLDGTVLGFTAAVSVITGILFGLAPALRSTRVGLTPALKATAGGSSVNQHTRLGPGKALVTAQVALSLVLLIGAGLFVRTLENLEHQDLGFNQHHLLLFAMDPTTHGYNGQRLIDLYRRLLVRFQALPGVKSATISEITLIAGTQAHWPVIIDGHKAKSVQSMGVDWNNVGPYFFKTMGIRLLLGRGVEWGDTSDSPKVAVVNEAFARHFLRGQNPIGHRFRLWQFWMNRKSPDYQIVGMAQDAKYASIRRAPRPTIYLPYDQMPLPPGGVHFELRAAGNPLALVPAVRQLVRGVDPELPIGEVKTQTEQIAEALVQERALARLSSFFGALAVLLACIGLYGLMAYAVTRRTHEIGIRIAVGAGQRDIVRMVVRETLMLAALGICVGTLAALAGARLISSFLYGIKPADPLTLIAASGMMAALAAFAGYLPARRASRVDPVVALRHE